MKKKYGLLLLCSAAFLSIDQWTKALVNGTLPQGESVAFLPHVLCLTHVQNTGAAWSLLEGKRFFFIALTSVVVVGILVFLWKWLERSLAQIFPLVLLLSGALGNLIDRVKTGSVIDMLKLELIDFPVFNVADMYLVVGFCWLLVYVLWIERSKTHGGD